MAKSTTKINLSAALTTSLKNSKVSKGKQADKAANPDKKKKKGKKKKGETKVVETAPQKVVTEHEKRPTKKGSKKRVNDVAPVTDEYLNTVAEEVKEFKPFAPTNIKEFAEYLENVITATPAINGYLGIETKVVTKKPNLVILTAEFHKAEPAGVGNVDHASMLTMTFEDTGNGFTQGNLKLDCRLVHNMNGNTANGRIIDMLSMHRLKSDKGSQKFGNQLLEQSSVTAMRWKDRTLTQENFSGFVGGTLANYKSTVAAYRSSAAVSE